MMEPPQLDKLTWTEADFDQMGWHDAHVHAFGLNPDTYEIVFDLDYIVQWVDPEQPGGNYRFWIAPATLVFENVRKFSLRMDPDPPDFEILAIDRFDPQPLPLGPTPWGSEINGPEWRWTMELSRGEMSFRSTGFRQYFRRPPVYVGKQMLSRVQRGDVSFTRGWDSNTSGSEAT